MNNSENYPPNSEQKGIDKYFVVDLRCGGLKSSVFVEMKVLEDCFSAYEPSKIRGLQSLAICLQQNYFDLEGWVPEVPIENLAIDQIYDQDKNLL